MRPVRVLSYSDCLAASVMGAAQRGIVQSVFRAAANITFPDDPGNFVLALNALDAPRVPNGLQLTSLAGTFPFPDLRVGMPVLFGAQRLHIESLALSLDLTYCERWNPYIARPEQPNLAIIEKNRTWLAHYLAGSCVGTGGKEGWTRGPCACPGGVIRRNTIRDPQPGQAQGSHHPSTIPPVPTKKPTHVGCRYPGMVGECLIADVPAMAQTLCGRGPGLTPSGDDILAGWMAANWLLHGPHPRLLTACQQILMVAEHQTHLISQCWLRYAAQGYVAEPIGRLLIALTHNYDIGENEEELVRATWAVLALGATSGRDMIQGILLGLAGVPGW